MRLTIPATLALAAMLLSAAVSFTAAPTVGHSKDEPETTGSIPTVSRDAALMCCAAIHSYNGVEAAMLIRRPGDLSTIIPTACATVITRMRRQIIAEASRAR